MELDLLEAKAVNACIAYAYAVKTGKAYKSNAELWIARAYACGLAEDVTRASHKRSFFGRLAVYLNQACALPAQYKANRKAIKERAKGIVDTVILITE